MQLIKFNLGPLETNCFLLHDNKEAVIVDAGGDPAEVTHYLEKHNLALVRVLITHLHFDHVLGASALCAATGATAWCNERDLPLLEGQLMRGSGFPPVPPFVSHNLDEGVLTILGEDITVLATPGHSPGSLSYYVKSLNAIFGGDVLFYRSVGRSDFPGGDTQTLMQTIKSKLYTLPENTRVYPGHGPSTTIEQEKKGNPFVN